MDGGPEGALAHHLATHHGVITRGQAAQFGLSRSRLDHLTRTGRWLRVGPNTYRLATAPETWEARARARALSARGLVSHTSGLRAWGVDGWLAYDPVHVTIGFDRRPTGPEDTIIHRSRHYDPGDAFLINAVPVTGVARTVIDSAALVGTRTLDAILDAVVRQKLTTLAEIDSKLDQLASTRGRSGVAHLRDLLDQRSAQSAVPDSRFNRMVGQVLIDAGLPTPVYEYEVVVGGRLIGRVDLAYPAARLAIECDSERWHRTRAAFQADPRRKNALLVAGFRVLTFTWDDLVSRPGQLAAITRSALAQHPPSRSVGDSA